MGIKVKCRNCNKEADSELFKLHYKYKMMVCPDCFSGRTEEKKKVQEKIERKEPPSKPADWDNDDLYLEKYQQQKEKEAPKFKKIPGTDYVQCTCNKCKYSFKYDPFRKKPSSCPYCSEEIPRINTFNML